MKNTFKLLRKFISKTMIIGIVLVAIITLSAITYGYSILSGISNNSVITTGIKPEKNQPINILLVGMDIGDAQNLENKDARRTDSIMVINFNPLTNKLQIVSVPRDTMIEVDAHDGNGDYQRYWKINSAYALGGQAELITQVEGLLDIEINYVAEVDYDAFRGIIDAIGGVSMYIEQDMFYDDDEQNLHIRFNKGDTVNLDGKMAEEFFRWRQNNDGTGFENGDLDRIENQHKLIRKIIEKCLDKSIIFKLPEIVDAITSNIKTNIPPSEIIKLGFNIMKIKEEDIGMSSVQGYFEDLEGQSFIVADKELNKDIIKSLSIGSLYKKAINKCEMKVMILNGTNTNGLASILKNKLYDLGYGTISTGNTEKTEKSKIIIEKNNELKELLINDIGVKNFDEKIMDEYKEFDVVIIIGEDKIDNLNIK